VSIAPSTVRSGSSLKSNLRRDDDSPSLPHLTQQQPNKGLIVKESTCLCIELYFPKARFGCCTSISQCCPMTSASRTGRLRYDDLQLIHAHQTSRRSTVGVEKHVRSRCGIAMHTVWSEVGQMGQISPSEHELSFFPALSACTRNKTCAYERTALLE
jgi:hypothetical protein